MSARVKTNRDLKTSLENEQIEKLIAAVANLKDKAFMIFLARTGIRNSEAIQLKVR